MALTNRQYEAIMKEYEAAQTRNRHLARERQKEVYLRIPAYEALESSIGSVCIEYGKRMLDGDDEAAGKLRKELSSLKERRRALLQEGGFPEDYLEPVYDCPDCHDTGYVTKMSPAGDEGLRRKCHCFRQKEITLLYEQSNIQEVLKHENFSTLSFQYYEGEDRRRFQDAVRISLDFVQNFKQDYQNIFFYGTVGTGKSFLSGCIAQELLKQEVPVIYFSSVNLFDTLAGYAFDQKAREDYSRFLADICGCDLLIIDDLGTELTNAFVTSQLFSCLNERNLNRRSTVISTNLSLEELQERYSDRIFSRISSGFTLCKLTGPDIRILKKRRQKD